MKYSGVWKNDKYNDTCGIYYVKAKKVYEGNWSMGKENGEGKSFYGNGVKNYNG